MTKKKKIKQKLIDKYRLVVLNENTFEEHFSLKLSLLNVFVLGGVFSVLLVAVTSVIIAFTPIKEYIPGYSSTSLKIKATKLNIAADSLKRQLAILENYTKAIQPILTGEIDVEAIDSIEIQVEQREIDDDKLNASKRDSLFREKVDAKTKFALQDNATSNVDIVFFTPLNGNISQGFDANSNHFAVDIVAEEGTPIKATADGTVIFSEWTLETGYVIIIKHTKNFVSVYKHNGTLLKEQGEFVKSGEAIATVGSSGELSTGPHLHFELWSNGYAVDPTKLIDFK